MVPVFRFLRGLWLKLLRLLQLGGPQDAPKGKGERELLLQGEPGPQPVSADDIDVSAASAAALRAEQRLWVLRHGHRKDEESDAWRDEAPRPWDPPLSATGRQQAAEAGRQLAKANGTPAAVDLVICSPFTRCLQTAAEIINQLGLPEGAWLVEPGLGEVLEGRLLYGLANYLAGARPMLGPRPKGLAVHQWLWCGRTVEDSLKMFSLEEAVIGSGVRVEPRLRDGHEQRWPVYKECIDEGLARYKATFRDVSDAYPGRNVLLVTHGEAVRAAVNICNPSSLVCEVRHTGYALWTRKRSSGGGTSPSAASAVRQRQRQQEREQRTGLLRGSNLGGDWLNSTPGWGPWQMVTTSGDEAGVMWIDLDE